MRARAAAVIGVVALTAGCRVFDAPVAPVATAYATTLVSPSGFGDARILSCGPGATAVVSVRNSGTVAAGYTVRVAYRRGGGTLASVGVAEVPAVAPGEERSGAAPGVPEAGELTCSLEGVVRT